MHAYVNSSIADSDTQSSDPSADSDIICQGVAENLVPPTLDSSKRFVMIEIKPPRDGGFGQGDDLFHAATLISEFRHAGLIVLESGDPTKRSSRTSFNLG